MFPMLYMSKDEGPEHAHCKVCEHCSPLHARDDDGTFGRLGCRSICSANYAEQTRLLGDSFKVLNQEIIGEFGL